MKIDPKNLNCYKILLDKDISKFLFDLKGKVRQSYCRFFSITIIVKIKFAPTLLCIPKQFTFLFFFYYKQNLHDDQFTTKSLN